MPFDGNGNYTLPSPAYPATPGSVITAASRNAIDEDLATALGKAVTRDGQSPAVANLPMGGFKLKDLAAGTVAGDSLRFEQLFGPVGPDTPAAARKNLGAMAADHSNIVAVATGAVNGIAAALPVPVTALTNGLTVWIKSLGANTIADPLFQLDATGQKTIVKADGRSLVAKDIPGAGAWAGFLYDAALDKWVLLNPTYPAPAGTLLQEVSFAADNGSSGNSSAYANLTNTTKTITPRSSNSRFVIEVMFASQVIAAGAGTNSVAAFAIYNVTAGAYVSRDYTLGASTSSGLNAQVDCPVTMRGSLLNAGLVPISFLLHGRYTSTSCIYYATGQQWTIREIQS